MPKTDCPECQGTGWKPIESGGVRRVTRCDCRIEDRTQRLLDVADIPKRYEHCDFDSFEVRKNNPSLRWAKQAALKFVKEYPTMDFGLLFVGPTGVGKTHLAVATVRELIVERGIECKYCGFRDLLKEIQHSWNPVSQTSELGILRSVLDVEVLLLDELASANPSDWMKETLWYIINSRYNKKQATLITTTIPRDEKSKQNEVRTPSGDIVPTFEKTLGDLGVTMRSRLYEMCKVVEMESDDYRKSVKQAGNEFRAKNPSNID
jgi:DNA replication protein DnaC